MIKRAESIAIQAKYLKRGECSQTYIDQEMSNKKAF